MAALWPLPLRQQVKALLDQFLLDPPALIGTASIELLERAAWSHAGRIESLGGQNVGRAFVCVQGAAPQLWVDPADTDYRGLYDQFARERLGLPGRPTDGGFNIDHVFPKTAGVLDGLSHVRVLAIAATSNQSAGRTVEKAMAQRARGVPGGKLLRSATWTTIGKAAGFPAWTQLPGGPDATADNTQLSSALFAYLAGCGILPPAGDLEHGLTAFTLGRIR